MSPAELDLLIAAAPTTDAIVDTAKSIHNKAGKAIRLHELEAAIPAAIDALYTARDKGATMHHAGAAAAIAALEALR